LKKFVVWFPKTRAKAFLSGIGRIFDFAGFYSFSPPFDAPQVVDYEVLASDWQKVGEDLTGLVGAFVYGTRQKNKPEGSSQS